jgi:rhamnosyltransferase
MRTNFNPISVVIRTKNSAVTLGDVISRLGLIGGDELIIVDSGSRDATLNMARNAGARIIDVSHEPFSYGKSLNAGFSVARNKWVLALSSHCVPVEPDLLGEYRRLLTEIAPDFGCIVGYGFGHAGEMKKQTAIEICTPADFAKGIYFASSNANSLYRREVWASHPFDEKIETAEDLEWSLWAIKNGHSLMRFPAAAVLYRSQLGLLAMFKKGCLESRVAKRLVSNPPFTVAFAVKTIFWNCLAVMRGRTSLGFTMRRIAYVLGDYWGRRVK